MNASKIVCYFVVAVSLLGASCTPDELIAQATIQAMEIATMESNIGALQAESTAQAVNYSNALATLSAQSEEIASLNNSIEALEYAATCDRYSVSLLPDYSGNAAMSERLKEWLAATKESIDIAEWDVLWSTSKTAIHRLIGGNHLFVFVVYFDESFPEIGLEINNSVFYITDGCWLDSPG